MFAVFLKNSKLAVPIQSVIVDTDCEWGTISAIGTNFSEWNQFDCHFHYTQAVYQNNWGIGTLTGLQNYYIGQNSFDYESYWSIL